MVAARSIDGASVETLRFLLDRGADLRAVSARGVTAAWYAAGKGGRLRDAEWRICPDHVDRLAFLLDAGLDPNESSPGGHSLLTEAAAAGDPARVRLLLSRRVSPNPTADREAMERRLEPAVRSMSEVTQRLGLGDVDLSQYLNLSAPSPDHSPLVCAAKSGSAACVEALIDAGALIEQKDWGDRTALMYARSADVVRVLISRGGDPAAMNKDEYDALQILLRELNPTSNPLHEGILDALVASGVRLDQPPVTVWWRTRLEDLASYLAADGVHYLLRRGAQPTRAALFSACWHSEPGDAARRASCQRIIELLVAGGVDPSSADERGDTAMYEAAFGDGGSMTAIRTLLRLGASPDPIDAGGVSPLMYAASRGQLECVRLLLDAGADPTRIDAEGRTPADWAMAHVEPWREIVSNPDEYPSYSIESQEAGRARQREALARAEATLQLIVDRAGMREQG